MRLKSLELQGFKSFPDRTVLNFEDGITVVVGPNGSGKSNIADAVRWVLGELSPKSIRGTKMEDVIFGGSDTRRPMSYAEVSLVMDNSETAGTGHLDTEFTEVTVTRRYYRKGESEYLINRKPARLRDIAELFMNTGVGKTGYSIIGQGRVAEIVSQKSEERRTVFEEAAGISKYRYKKNEAERKLADVEANLLRLSDIISELSSRVGPLEKEAKAAKEYVVLYDQKKAVDISIWLADAGTLQSRCAEAEQAYTTAKLSLEDIDSIIAGLESRSEKLQEEALTGRAEAEKADNELNAAREHLYKAGSSRKVFENDIDHIRSQMQSGETELKLRRVSLSEAEERAEGLKKQLEEAKKKLENINSQLSEALEDIRGKTALEASFEEKILEAEELTGAKNDAAAEVRLRISALEGSREAENGRDASLDDEIAACREDVESLEKKLSKATGAVAEYKSAIAAENEKTEKITSGNSGKQAEYEKVMRDVSRLSAEADSLRQRSDALKRMEELLEGYNQSVKNVISASEKGRIHGICGTVSQLIRVETRYAVAVETALGANIQNIVVETEASAKEAIAYLKSTNGGRATFYPLTSVRSQPLGISQNELEKRHGYIGIASDLAAHEARYDGVIGYMLGRTAVFDNIDSASDAAKYFGYKLRIVTLDGQLINAGGSFTGGSVKRDSGMLTRNAEITRLEDEETAKRTEAEKFKNRADGLLKEIKDSERETASIREKTELLSALMQAENTRAEVASSQKKAAEERLASLENDLAALGQRFEHYEAEHKRLETELSEAEKAASEALEVQKSLIAKRSDAATALKHAQDKYNTLIVEKTAAEKDIEAQENSITFSEDTLLSLREQIEKTERLGVSLAERLTDAENGVETSKADEEAYSAEVKRLEEERGKLLNRNLEYEKKQAELRDEMRERSHVRENLFRDFTRYESDLTRLKEERDRVAAAMWDEYELTYSTAAELGIEPVTEENRAEALKSQAELKRKIKALGHVNVGAIEEYAEVKERYEFNTTQFNDLSASKDSLTSVISRMEGEMKTQFADAIEKINHHFGKVFKELFGGGSAEIRLTDPEDILNCGIEINVAPPGKIIKSLSLLSGGEQAFVAIALIFAILNVNPTPFCIFDEIEAALDEVNVFRVADYMKKYSSETQFIVITHRRGTMEAGDTIYGITMPDRGISKVLSMNVGEVEARLGTKLN